MGTTDLPTGSRIAPIVLRQEHYARRRRFLRDVVLRRLAFRLLVNVRVDGTGLVPAEGPLIVIMNHIGAIDPFVVVGAISTALPRCSRAMVLSNAWRSTSPRRTV